ncbi:MAG TPA: flavodoxin domain-containing protein [Acidimicrobiia bacterium]
MRVLVTAGSKHGATTEMARMIGEVLAGEGADVDLAEPGQVGSIEEYDAVVIGSAVYMGRWLETSREFVDRCADALAARQVWLFSSGPIGDPPVPEEDPVDIAGILDRTGARAHRVFPGKLERSRLSFGEKAVVAAVRTPDGDFRPWDEIREWAEEIAQELRVGAA